MDMSGASGTLNLSAQRISFVNKIGIILKATADDESPTPGYLFKDICDISYESVGYSESLVEFLVDRVKSRSIHIKYKTLKLLKYVVEKGSREFQLGLRKHSDVIKECTKFGGPPHPMHGNAPYVMIRNIAKELCESLYSVEFEGARSPGNEDNSEMRSETKYGGLGPMRSGGTIQGFGNTPTNQPQSLGGAILDSIEKLGAKITETPADRQAALLAKLNLSGSTSNYQPPVVTTYSADQEEDSERDLKTRYMRAGEETLNTNIRKPVKKHTPGKAGGGWGDDEDEDSDSLVSTEDLRANEHLDSNTSPDRNIKLETDEENYDADEESDLVNSVLSQGSTGPGGALFRPSEVSAFTMKCAHLDGSKIVHCLAMKLSSDNAAIILRALQLLEGIIFNDSELVGINAIVMYSKDALVSCYLSLHNGQHFQNQHSSSVDDNDSTENQRSGALDLKLTNMASAKAAKIILALQQLSSDKNILPSEKFKHFLPDQAKQAVKNSS